MAIETPSKHREEAEPNELLTNYRPLALKAVLAALSIQGKTIDPKPRELPEYGQLPEGFHLPIELE